MKNLEEFKTSTVYALAKEIGMSQTQTQRWLDNGALVSHDGRIYIETKTNKKTREILAKLHQKSGHGLPTII